MGAAASRPGGSRYPLASDRGLRYQDWVTGKRRQVRELTGGRAGYLHIPDMMGEGWAHFHRDLRVEMAQAALVVDVRSNPGGHVSELVIEKLARRITGWDIPRWMAPSTYPRDAPRGPLVALADENAGSDGDIVTAAVRILGLGPVVGARAWGGLIGLDAPFELVDGTAMTVPGTRSGWRASAGSWRTTAWTPTSRCSSHPTTGPRAGMSSWRPRCGWPWRPSRPAPGHPAGHVRPPVQAAATTAAPPAGVAPGAGAVTGGGAGRGQP